MEALNNKVPWAAKSPIFKKVSEIIDIRALSKEERIKYEHTKPIVTILACTNTNTRLANERIYERVLVRLGNKRTLNNTFHC